MNKLRIVDAYFRLAPGEAFDEAWLEERAVPAAPAGRAKIVRFERELAKLPQVEFELQHFFVDGLYVRQIFIPAGVALVGYIHMQPCITSVLQGCIVIAGGERPVTLKAPYTCTCPAGSKKAGYALQDTVWQDAYLNPDNERDIAKLEARLTADTHEEYVARIADVKRLPCP